MVKGKVVKTKYILGFFGSGNDSTMAVLLETSRGDFVIDLFLKECPKTCLNFLKLCK